MTCHNSTVYMGYQVSSCGFSLAEGKSLVDPELCDDCKICIGVSQAIYHM
jgi:hypothetical protein